MAIRSRWMILWLIGVSLPSACGGDAAEPSLPEPEPVPAEVVLAAGNIAKCSGAMDEATAAILDTLAGTVFTLGDNVIPDDAADAFSACYEPSWGRHKQRTRATLGNHEYDQGTASAFFDYFGDRVGPRGRGYYSFDLGNWHIIVLDINDAVAYLADDDQDRWLQADLKASSRTCTLAMWHSARFFSSDTEGYTKNDDVIDAWKRLYAAGVDVVLNGHQHHYERFPLLTPAGARDEKRGIRQFNVGTGGESTAMPVALSPDREVLTAAFGVLKLTLDARSYAWEFIPVTPGEFNDSGSGTCH